MAHGGETVLPTHKSGGGSGFPGGPVMILTTREVATWLQGMDRDYRRQNGGRGLLAT